ncbi:uncharacterized protein SPAPADRAFT_134263 [Spathaspora passalidarum NRRL Y-27907]|uniref:SCP domain-containing protein n=1 Tax=Spathaspora passalidarum (strain NRRL Y-27907 / 11-Y1) TaxID=619300 RepID=G3AJZ7_SPAPN|nr:uncharacterized protein SPAPADRAFT_134263 [Spathaspora passalidarum NRRL Y-27907]EGW34048.1 hypothetical protein SPAPADRAFT_134263 [Spathaspora passalidarum NRRL Y-27907]
MKFSQVVSIALLSVVAQSAIITKTATDTSVVTVVIDPVTVVVKPQKQAAPTSTQVSVEAEDPAPAPKEQPIEVQAPAPSEAPQPVSSPSEAPQPVPSPSEAPQPAPSPSKAPTAAPKKQPVVKSEGKSTDQGDFSGVRDLEFSKQILNAHNEKRAAHGVPALTWSKKVYNFAQQYADAYDCSGNLKHSGGPFGENLGVGYKTAASVVDAWYNEGKNYNYNTRTVLDHFTAVIWKSTTQLGCAYKDCSSNNWGLYIICNYDPVGNVASDEYKKDNLLPPIN